MKTIELNAQKRDGSAHSLGGKIFDTNRIKGTVYRNGVLLDIHVHPMNGAIFTHMLGDGISLIALVDASYDIVYAKLNDGVVGDVTITIEES